SCRLPPALLRPASFPLPTNASGAGNMTRTPAPRPPGAGRHPRSWRRGGDRGAFGTFREAHAFRELRTRGEERHAPTDLDRADRVAGPLLRRRRVRRAVRAGRVVRATRQARLDAARPGVPGRLDGALRAHGRRGVAGVEAPGLRRRALGARRVPHPARTQRGVVLALFRAPPHRPRLARRAAAVGRDRHHRAALLATPPPRRRAAPALSPLGLVRRVPELRDLAARSGVSLAR